MKFYTPSFTTPWGENVMGTTEQVLKLQISRENPGIGGYLSFLKQKNIWACNTCSTSAPPPLPRRCQNFRLQKETIPNKQTGRYTKTN